MVVKVLSSDLAAKIAAGEVVERPASVAKELIENSLDAQATSITVEVKGGGVDLIRVTDNGTGIDSSDVDIVFQRHATSKIASVKDLEAISTLGFRGEALPSIAAVSQVTLLTRTDDEEAGTLVEVKSGDIASRTRQGCPVGTMVTVRNLFGDIPARRKFLRSEASETSRIQALVTRYAMAYSEARFSLVINDSQVFASHGSSRLREVIASVYGLEVAEAMLEIVSNSDDHHDGPTASGLISTPSITRANRSYITFFVNRRWVQSRLLGYALEQAYHGFLIERRYPIAAINLTIPLHEVDVNVHPAKTEVRFQRESQVFSVVQRAVRQTLSSFSPIPTVGSSVLQTSSESERGQAPTFWHRELSKEQGRERVQPQETLDALSISSSRPSLPIRGALPILRPLGQVQNTYIVAEGPDGMYLIDQHAAHERILFEKVVESLKKNMSETQRVLEPTTIQLSPEQGELVSTQMELLARSGLQVEAFGEGTYLIRGVPSLITDANPREAFLGILDLLNEGGGFEDWQERLAYSIACHSAIRAGKALTQDEMAEMVRQLEGSQQPHTCPHGRPTMIHLSSGQLEREFGRR